MMGCCRSWWVCRCGYVVMMIKEGQVSKFCMMCCIEIVLFLQSVELFKFCLVVEVVCIVGILEQYCFLVDECIYCVNDLVNMLYCVVDGQLVFENEEGGDSVLIGLCGLFGVFEILSGCFCVNYVCVVFDIFVLGIVVSDFFDFLLSNVEIVKVFFWEVFDDWFGLFMM